jgi:hypothetical protein
MKSLELLAAGGTAVAKHALPSLAPTRVGDSQVLF